MKAKQRKVGFMRTSTTHETTTRLQLTRKGQLLLGGLITIMVGVLLTVAWFQSPIPPAMAADQQQPDVYQKIMVQPGDTLWGISSRVAQGENQSDVLEQITTYNDLETSELQVGQTLYIPVRH